MTSDGRRDPRKPTALQIRFKSATIAEFVEKHAKDISRGGMFIKMKSPFPAGTLLKFDVRITDKSNIHGVGRVAWCRTTGSGDTPPGMGVKFIKIDDMSRQVLEAILVEKDGLSLSGDSLSFDDPLPKPKATAGSGGPVTVSEAAKRTVIGVPKPTQVSASHSAGSGAEARDTDEEKRPSAPSPIPGTPPPRKEKAPAETEEDRLGFLGMSASEAEAKDEAFLSGTKDDFIADVDSALDNALGLPSSAPAALPELDNEAAPSEPADSDTAVRPQKKEDAGKAAPQEVSKAAPTQSTPLSAAPEIAPKRKGDGAVAAAIIVLLLAVAGAGSWYFLRQKTPDAKAPADTPFASASETPSQASAAANKVNTVSADSDTDTVTSADTASPAAQTSISIESDPKGARVFIDETEQTGTTPMVVSGRPRDEKLEIRIQQFGFASHVETVVLSEAEVRLSANLKRIQKILKVETDPPGAEIHLGDRRLGRTPVKVAKGFLTETFELKIEKDGFETVVRPVAAEDWVESEDAVTATIKIELEKKDTASRRHRRNNGPDLDADAALQAILHGIHDKPEEGIEGTPGAASAATDSIGTATETASFASEDAKEEKPEPAPEPEEKTEPAVEPEPEIEPEPEPDRKLAPEPDPEQEPAPKPDPQEPSGGGIDENPF